METKKPNNLRKILSLADFVICGSILASIVFVIAGIETFSSHKNKGN